jgi:hypothetical protein
LPFSGRCRATHSRHARSQNKRETKGFFLTFFNYQHHVLFFGVTHSLLLFGSVVVSTPFPIPLRRRWNRKTERGKAKDQGILNTLCTINIFRFLHFLFHCPLFFFLPPRRESGQTISYNAERIIGNGSFGVVFQATVEGTGEVVAIKKVLQDKRFKNRELQIMRQLVKEGRHPNIVHLQVDRLHSPSFQKDLIQVTVLCLCLCIFQHCFYSSGAKPEELYLNLVLEYVPETVYSVARQWQKSKQALPLLQVRVTQPPRPPLMCTLKHHWVLLPLIR